MRRKGTATGPGDCDLTGMQGVTADASGRVKVDLTVSKGPFGANKIVCGPAQACLVSVTQATPSPIQEADAPITFGLPGHAHRDDQPAMIVTSAARLGDWHEDESGPRNAEEHPCHQQCGCERECHGRPHAARPSPGPSTAGTDGTPRHDLRPWLYGCTPEER